MDPGTTYATLKLVHVGAAILTITGFVLRGIWMLMGSGLLYRRPVRIVPHVIDTAFLLSGIGLIVTLRLPVLAQDWLLMKIAALVVYVVLGTIALRRGRSMRTRATAFAAAILTFAYIAGVALTRSPASWLA